MKKHKSVKIALFLPSLGGGGAERVMVSLAKGFAQRGYQIDLVLARAEGPFLKEVSSDIQVIDLGVDRTIKALPGLISYLRNKKPEVLLSTLNHANLIVLLANGFAGAHTPIYVREANTASISTQRGASLRARAIPFLARQLYRSSAGVIAVSHGVGDDLLKAGITTEDQLDVIYNPSITPELEILAKEEVSHPFYFNDYEVILGVGSLSRQKDFSTLIRAFKQVSIERQNARLVILGEGNERAKLEALIKKLGLVERVDLPGFVENPFSYMEKASVYVLSSAWEGLPNTLLQAMGTHVPVVATDCPSGPSEILENGRWGALVPVGDSDAMALAITNILTGQWAPEDDTSHLQRFHREHIVDRYLKIMLDL